MLGTDKSDGEIIEIDFAAVRSFSRKCPPVGTSWTVWSDCGREVSWTILTAELGEMRSKVEGHSEKTEKAS
jgi:hypothetical protein